MNTEELTDLIIKELGKHHDRKDIAAKICEQSSLGWGEAEQLIAEVEQIHKRKIAVRQGPFLVSISLGMLVLGIGLMAYNFELLVSIFNRDLFEQILSIQSGYYRLAGLITGLGMIVGGLYGAWSALGSLLPD